MSKVYDHLFAAGPSDNVGTFMVPEAKSKDDLPDAPRGKKRPTYIAVDFDATLCQQTEDHDDFDQPPITDDKGMTAQEFMVKLHDRGYRTIVWTVRGDDEQVKAWLEKNEIPHDFVNYNPDQPKGGSNKLKADAYADDKAAPFHGDYAETLDAIEEALEKTERNTKHSKRHPVKVNVVGKSFIIGDAGGGYWNARDEDWSARGRIAEATEYKTRAEAEVVARRLPLETGATGVEVMEKGAKKKKQLTAVTKAIHKVQPTSHHDEENRTVTYVMTTGDTDRDDETVDPEGGIFDDYMMNPAVTFNHDTDSLSIGSMKRIWNAMVGEGTEYPEVQGPARMGLLGDVYFSKEDEFSDTCYRKVLEGTLGGGSISFLPVEGETEQGDRGNHYRKWKLLEFAVCPVGSNPSSIALARRLKRLARRVKYMGGRCKALAPHSEWPTRRTGVKVGSVLSWQGSSWRVLLLDEEANEATVVSESDPDKSEIVTVQNGRIVGRKSLRKQLFRVGDRVKINAGDSKGAKGAVTSISEGKATVKLDLGGEETVRMEWLSYKSKSKATGDEMQAEDEGADAYEAGQPKSSNPYNNHAAKDWHDAWEHGWQEAQDYAHGKSKALNWVTSDAGVAAIGQHHFFHIYDSGGTTILEVDGKKREGGSIDQLKRSAESRDVSGKGINKGLDAEKLGKIAIGLGIASGQEALVHLAHFGIGVVALNELLKEMGGVKGTVAWILSHVPGVGRKSMKRIRKADQAQRDFQAGLRAGKMAYPSCTIMQDEKDRYWLVNENGDKEDGPFDSRRGAMSALRDSFSDKPKRGKKHMRQFWINKKLKYAWFLKSEGTLDKETSDYIEARGLDGVKLEDEPPEKDMGYEKYNQRQEVVQLNDGKWYIFEGMDEVAGPYTSESEANERMGKSKSKADIQPCTTCRGTGHVNGDVCPDCQGSGTQVAKTKGETEEVADDVAQRAKEISEAGSPVGPAIEAAMDEQEVPKRMRKAVKALAQKRLARLARRKASGATEFVCPDCGEVFKLMSDAKVHAHDTGHAASEQRDVVKSKKKKRKYIVKTELGYWTRGGYVGEPSDAERMSRSDALATVGSLTAGGMTPEVYKRRKAKFVVRSKAGYVAKEGYVEEPTGAVRMTRKEAEAYMEDKSLDDPGLTVLLYKDVGPLDQKAPTEDVANWEGVSGGGDEGGTTEWQKIDDDKLTGWQMKRRKAASDTLDVTPEKACKILADGEANGKPLTDAQKGMFGAKCAEAHKHFKPCRGCKAMKKCLCPGCVKVLRKGIKRKQPESAYEEGLEAYHDGEKLNDNPYNSMGSTYLRDAQEWSRGWQAGKQGKKSKRKGKADPLEGADADYAQSPMRPGFKFYAKLIKAIEEDAADLDHPHVIAEAEKMVQKIETAMKKTYPELWEDWTETRGDWNVYTKDPGPGDHDGLPIPKNKDLADAQVQELDDGTWCVYDPDTDDWLTIDGRDTWPSEEEAQNAVQQGSDKGVSEQEFKHKCKHFVPRRRFKRMNKAHSKIVKEAAEFLEDAAQAPDTPKRLASGMKHHSKELKSISDEVPQQEQPQELSKADEDKIDLALKSVQIERQALNRAFYRVSGEKLNGN